MVYALLKEVKERSALDPALIEDICLGNVREPHFVPKCRRTMLVLSRR